MNLPDLAVPSKISAWAAAAVQAVEQHTSGKPAIDLEKNAAAADAVHMSAKRCDYISEWKSGYRLRQM